MDSTIVNTGTESYELSWHVDASEALTRAAWSYECGDLTAGARFSGPAVRLHVQLPETVRSLPSRVIGLFADDPSVVDDVMEEVENLRKREANTE